MDIVYIDFETRSKVDIKKAGAWRYAEDPSTEIMCLCYTYNTWEHIVLYTPDMLEQDNKNMTALKALAGNPAVIFEAHNAFFEQSIWHNIMVKRYGWPEIPIERWRCSAAKAASYALPRALGKCGAALRLPVQKDDEGHRVMLQLSKPRRPSKDNPDTFWEPDKVPDKFETLYRYCQTDVEAERAISHTLRDLRPMEQRVWQLDQHINRRGITVDQEAVDAALYLISKFAERAKKKANKITGGMLTSLNQRNKLLDWITQQGVDMPGLTKEDVNNALKQELPSQVRDILKLRQQVSKTSTAKYRALKVAVCKDGRLRDILMYHGASTGRWSGKLVQLQNIPRGSIKDTDTCIEVIKDRDLDWLETLYDDPMEAISSCLRGVFTASPGKRLVVADYAAIEARVLVWLAMDPYAVKQFHEGVDTYIDMASVIYNVPANKVDAFQRFVGKQAVLGCGYGMGAPKFQSQCEKFGQPVTEELAQTAVDAYRSKYEKVKYLWWGLEDAAIKAVRSPGEQLWYGKVGWVRKGRFLYCILPSGRILSYCEPKLEIVLTPWDQEKEQLTFMGVNSITKKWERQSTYGGKLTENVTQAVARDLMAEAMIRVEKEGFEVLLSVHDELITEIQKDTYLKNPVERLEQLMSILPYWAMDPDIGHIPVAAEGWTGERYKK